MAPVTLCLNMIVKNESRIIIRLLESVIPIIDTYVICDTGSTDDTPNIIRQYFDSKGIPGEVIHEPFKNFGYNRTFALKAAKGKATYALLLDADMIFKIEPSFNNIREEKKLENVIWVVNIMIILLICLIVLTIFFIIHIIY